ncbi:MAG: hypothetical protein IT380_00230 [Myxococcales bacterium]|nr:hypothetical protein [Myxococcales bacterium]
MRSLVLAVVLASCRASPVEEAPEEGAFAHAGSLDAGVSDDVAAQAAAAPPPPPPPAEPPGPPPEVLSAAPWRLEVRSSDAKLRVTTTQVALSTGLVSETTERARLQLPPGTNALGLLDQTRAGKPPTKANLGITARKESSTKQCPETPAWLKAELDRTARAWLTFLAAPGPLSGRPKGLYCPDCGSLNASLCATLPEGTQWCRAWTGALAFGFMTGEGHPPPVPTERELEERRLEAELYSALGDAMDYARADCFDRRAVMTRAKWKAYFTFRRDYARALQELATRDDVYAAARPDERDVLGYGDALLLRRVLQRTPKLQKLASTAVEAARRRARLEAKEVTELSKWDHFFCEDRNRQLTKWACTAEGMEALERARCEQFHPGWGLSSSLEAHELLRLPSRFGADAVALVRELEPDFLAMMERWSGCGCAPRLDQRRRCAPASTPLDP